MKNKAKHFIFKGSVQGVGFRFTARNVASRYDLTGYVKNLPDNTVEMLIQGHPEDIKYCVEDLKESFRVTGVTEKEVSYNPSLAGFSIRH